MRVEATHTFVMPGRDPGICGISNQRTLRASAHRRARQSFSCPAAQRTRHHVAMIPLHITRAYHAAMFAALGALMAVLFAVMCVQVFFRYALNDSLIWAEEVCRYLLIWVSFLAVGLAYQRGEVAAMRVLIEALPVRLAAIVAILADGAVLVLLGFITVYGWRYAVFAGGQMIPAADFIWTDLFGGKGPVGLSLFWVYVAVPVGSVLLGAHIALHVLDCLRALSRGEPPRFPEAGAET
jgi:TRAP-type C4-dicarboxylate transport system permease small subunit